MSEYRLDIEGPLQLSDYSNISDYMGVIGENDRVTIVIDKDLLGDIEMLGSMLSGGDFTIQTKGGKEDEKVYITAHRKGH